MKSGELFYAEAGDIIYIPYGALYKFEMTEKLSDNAYALGINFHIYEKNGTLHSISQMPIIFNVPNSEYYQSIFERMRMVSAASVQSTSRLKCGFYEIISDLCEAYQSKSKVGKDFTIIENGIRYLETNDRLDRSISEIAAMCAVSETYFRRLFKKYSGVSPKEYILRVKIDKAKLILKETNLQVSEIAEMFGISDTAYFCRMFKKRTGISPLIYRSKEPCR